MVVKTKKPLIEGMEPLRRKVGALRGSEEKYKALVAASQDAIVEMDEKGRIILWNKGAEQIFGYSVEEILNQPVTKLMVEKHRERHRNGFESFLNGNRSVRRFVEGEGLRKDGSRFSIEWSLSSWQENGKTIFAAIGKDVSARKKAEDSARKAEKRYGAIFDNRLQIVYIHDEQGRFLEANDFALESLGYTQDDFGKVFLSDIIHPDDLETAFQAVAEVGKKGYMERPIEVRIFAKSGEMLWVEVLDVVLEREGEHFISMGIASDITERKEAEEALKESEERYRGLFENSIEAVFTVDLDGNITSCNRALEELLGYTWEELSKMELAGNIAAPDSSEFVLEQYRKVLSTGEPIRNLIYEIIRKDGERRIVEGYVTVLKKGNKIVGLQGNFRDITERKRAEEVLRESEERYSRLYEGVSEAVALFTLPDLRISYWNKRFEEYAKQTYGKDAKDISATDIPPKVEADDWNMAMEALAKTLAGEPVSKAYEIRTKDVEGKRRVIEAKPSFYKEKGQVVGIQVMISDITERKRAERALHESEEKLRRIVESIGEGITVTDLNGIITDVNERVLSLGRFSSKSDLLGKSAIETVASRDRERALADMLELLQQGGVGTQEYTLTRADGTEYPAEISAGLLGDAAGSPLGFVSVIRDITERKRAEEALQESQERYLRLYEGINEAEALFNLPDLKISHWNKRFEDLQKLLIAKDAEDLTISDIAAAVEPDDWNMAMEVLAKGLAGELWPDIPVLEIKVKDLKGKRRVLEVKPSFYEEKGQVVGVQVAIIDISERKKAEEALKQSEENYRALFESAVIGTFVIDPETMKIVMGNQAVAKTFGFSSVEEGIGVNPLDFIPPDDRERVLNIIVKDLLEQDLRQIHEFQVMTKDGREIWISATGTRILHQGRLAALVSCIDVTELKQAQERLEDSFIDVVETVSRAVEMRDPYTAGHQRRVAELARLVGEKLGLDEHRVQGLYIGGLLHDIGKVAIPASILSKMGELTEEEWALICAHPKQGYKILKDTRLPWPVADMTLHHHERLDGSGYPHGIKGDKLSLEVRIIAVCDVVEAMGSHRPYRPARSKQEVMEEIQGGRGTKYDADVADMVLQIIENGEFEFTWNSGDSKSRATEFPVPLWRQ